MPEPTQQQEPEAETSEATAPAPQPQPTPPWGSDDEFDPQKAWKLIQNLRGDLDELKPKAAKLKQLEDAQKTETQKLTEALEAAQRDASTHQAELARFRAAVKYGLSEDVLDLLGDGDPDEIEGRAQRLAQHLVTAEEARPVVPSSRNQGASGSPSALNGDPLLRTLKDKLGIT